MKRGGGIIAVALSAVLLLGAADGSWLRNVPARDHLLANPMDGDSTESQVAIVAGAQVFKDDCAKCHGENAMGRSNRPALISDRVAHATDGDLFWMITNGNAWKGMPAWQMLPGKQRWEVVAYVRSLNLNSTGTQSSGSGAPGKTNYEIK